jgi:hypothetical protein
MILPFLQPQLHASDEGNWRKISPSEALVTPSDVCFYLPWYFSNVMFKLQAVSKYS